MSADHSKKMKVKQGMKELEVIKKILNDAGIFSYEEAVVNQLLFLTYDHVSSILENALTFSKHANKSELDTEDIFVALKLYEDKHPYNTETCHKVSSEHAKKINSIPLPEVKNRNCLRIPSQNTLTAPNYKLKTKENEQIRYIYKNESGPMVVTSATQQDQRTLLKRPTKIYNTPQKVIFRPNLYVKYVMNPESQNPIFKKRKEN